MAQDTALLRYLLKWARRAPWSWSQRDLAFEFDWVNDYISSNATIGRTGYDMNVSWNVSTGSDGDGSYIQFNGNRDYTAWTGTRANIWVSSSPSFTQATSFTIKVRVKVITLPPNNVSWLFGSDNDACINTDSTWNDIIMWLRWSTLVANTYSWELTLWVLYDIYMSYDATTWKFHSYKWTSWWASVLLNAWGTSWPATFTTNSRYLWDSAFLSGSPSSSN